MLKERFKIVVRARLRVIVHWRGALSSKCGSGLAREGGVSVNVDVECDGPFASKPAPTLAGVSPKKTGLAQILWERACPRLDLAANEELKAV